MKVLLAGVLVARALIHVAYLTPAPPRTAGGWEWPFALTRSWLVGRLQLDSGIVRALGAIFHPWLILGVAIDAALLGAVLVGGWQPVGAER